MQKEKKGKYFLKSASSSSSSSSPSWQLTEQTNSARLTKYTKKQLIKHKFEKNIIFRFLDSSGPALLTLLEEESAKLRGHSDLEGQEQKDVEFSDRVTVLNTEWVEKRKKAAAAA